MENRQTRGIISGSMRCGQPLWLGSERCSSMLSISPLNSSMKPLGFATQRGERQQDVPIAPVSVFSLLKEKQNKLQSKENELMC